MSSRNRGFSPSRRVDEKKDTSRHERSRSRSPRRHSRSDERRESLKSGEVEGSEQWSHDRRPVDNSNERWPHDKCDEHRSQKGKRSHDRSNELRLRDESNERRSRSQEHRSNEQSSLGAASHHTLPNNTSQSSEKEENASETKANVDQNFALSGKLTAETNTYRGVVIMYSEPPEAKIPKTRWRLYPFKENESLSTLYIHRQSAYLIGRDRRIVDIPIDHPSCSKQHSVLQYRLVQYEKKDGSVGRRVRPYIIDLNSINGTFVNNQRIESARYVELKEKDVLKFGFSSREYVVLHENSKEEEQDDSGNESAPPPPPPATVAME